MRITNISCASYQNGSFMVEADGAYVTVNFTEEEADRLRSLVNEIFISRQAKIAESIASASLPQLTDLRPVE